jgi:hypothetical protein
MAQAVGLRGVPCLRHLFIRDPHGLGPSQWDPAFDPRRLHNVFVVNKVAL